MKVSLAGGAPITLTPVAGLVTGAVWLRNGEIVFSLNSRGMRQVSSEGGEVREIMRPVPLPGERWGLCDGIHRDQHEFVPA